MAAAVVMGGIGAAGLVSCWSGWVDLTLPL